MKQVIKTFEPYRFIVITSRPKHTYFNIMKEMGLTYIHIKPKNVDYDIFKKIFEYSKNGTNDFINRNLNKKLWEHLNLKELWEFMIKWESDTEKTQPFFRNNFLIIDITDKFLTNMGELQKE